MLSNDELDQVSFAITDINTLVKEKFASLDRQRHRSRTNGTATSRQLESMGVDDVIATYQQAYDRFQQGGE